MQHLQRIGFVPQNGHAPSQQMASLRKFGHPVKLVSQKTPFLRPASLARRLSCHGERNYDPAYWRTVFEEIENNLIAALRRLLAEKFDLNINVLLEQPKQSSFGELAIPVAFQLARQLKRPPRQIAEELAGGLTSVPGVASFEIAGNGYINVRLDRAEYAVNLLRQGGERAHASYGEKIVVEHTNINPNKAAHIGHLRNAILGDTFVRMLRNRGRHVEVQNYIDNTGVQVADVVVGFHYLERKAPADVRALIADPNTRFDYLCWDLYARTSSYYQDHPDAKQWRADTLHAIEAGDGDLAEMAHIVADAIVKAHLKTMLRLDIEYDVLPRESEILHLKFWATAFELLKERKAIYFEEQGKNKGCWVMPSAAFRESAAASEEEEDGDDSKVIVRSNGTVTYVGKDIAYQLWKFGLLGKDFYYKPWTAYPDGHQVWVTTDQPSTEIAPPFGHATQVFNVIDSRQSYLQDVVVAGLRALDFQQQANASVHFSYEMVALTPQTCVAMGIQLSDDDKKKPYVEVSGRKGLGVKADDLLDKLIETALAEVVHRHPETDPADRQSVAQMIAVGALRYFMLKFTRNSLIAFDFHEALSFEGETGPYVQYAAVRAGNILKKFTDRGETLPVFENVLNRDVFARYLESEDLWQLVLLASKSSSAVERAISSGEPAHVAKYAFQLAQSFNNFYHEHSVIAEENADRRATLLWLTTYVRRQLLKTLAVLGIQQPAYM
jgi:arginyl-tRNA synthetase